MCLLLNDQPFSLTVGATVHESTLSGGELHQHPQWDKCDDRYLALQALLLHLSQLVVTLQLMKPLGGMTQLFHHLISFPSSMSQPSCC